MSTHPNAILLLTLTPDNLARKTYRAILEEMGFDPHEESPSLTIGDGSWHINVMEEDYDEDMQIQAKAGDIAVFAMVTYGYGEVIAWDELAKRKAALEEWARGICERHHCTAAFFVTANYW